MVRSKVATGPAEILSASEIATLRDEQKEIQTTIREAQDASGSSRGGAIDVVKLKNRSAYLDRAIEERSAPILKGNSKDKLMAEERDIADKLAAGIPTHYEMDRPAKNPGAVDKNLNWQKRNADNIQRWVQIQNAKVAMGEERTYIDSLRREK